MGRGRHPQRCRIAGRHLECRRKLLGADQRFGAIHKGLDATMVIVEGNPLTDIHAMSSISSVIFKGERISRSTLFEEE